METLTWLRENDYRFPPPEQALRDPNGLLAVGGDLEPGRLLRAYQNGIFPWYEEGQPILWWSPDPRMVLFPDRMHVSRSFRKTLQKAPFTVTSDRDFEAVIKACAASRLNSSGTWITPEMHESYCRLHEQGYAHSIEIWSRSNLVGGLYGLALPGVFFGESMFSLRSDASKVALYYLTRNLLRLGYQVIDCQVSSAHLASLGAREIPRQRFRDYLPADPTPPHAGPWDFSTR